ncbi:NADH-quinone oxidoreductase subunit C [Oligoflexia bacterium]|nr:NADH-quinone oxidoreductase subunit C [Oligoflexia bacterium]
MTPVEIHSALLEHFGDLIGEWHEPEAGDSFLTVKAEGLHKICAWLKEDSKLAFDYLRLITAVDRTECFSSVYHLYSYTHKHAFVLRVDLAKEDPTVASVSDLWPTADWQEREAFDMMGIVYTGHPNLRRILLPLDWEGHPLRKDYEDPTEYHGIKHD